MSVCLFPRLLLCFLRQLERKSMFSAGLQIAPSISLTTSYQQHIASFCFVNHIDILHWVQLVLLLACLKSQQHASVSQGWICTDNFTCCHTETEVADQTFYLTQSQYTDTGQTSPSADPIMPGAWQGSHWSANF